MKQGTRFKLDVAFDVNLDDVESVRFKFTQGSRHKVFEYPSAFALRVEGENVVSVLWTPQDTFLFEPSKKIKMDTIITMTGTGLQPPTDILQIDMQPTLFTKLELGV